MWAELIQAAAESEGVAAAKADALQAKYIQSVECHPLYGSCFFHVRKQKLPAGLNGLLEASSWQSSIGTGSACNT